MKRLVLSILLVVLAVSTLAVAGCGSSASSAKQLEAHQWRVTKLGESDYTGLMPITSAFKDGTIAGSTGVNRYSGTYSAPSGSQISIKLGPMTLIGGTPEAMAAEQKFIAGLGSAASYAVDDQSLTLFDASGKSVIVYEVYTPAALVGTKWQMTAYNNGRGGFQSALATVTVTAEFAADGTVSGTGGVNQYHGKYVTQGDNKIAVTDIASTKMLGPEEQQQQEDAYLAALQRASTYAIEGNTLEMRDAGGAAMVSYTAR